MQHDRAARERNIRRLWVMMEGELRELVPRGIEKWEDIDAYVDLPERRVQKVAAEYIEGEASKEDVLAAAEQVRAAWRRALELYGPSGGKAA